MMVPLITLAYARAHLRTDSISDGDVYVKLLAATAIIMKHVKLTEIPDDWLTDTLPSDANLNEAFVPTLESTDESPNSSPVTTQYILVPGNISAAIALVTGELFENREAGVSNPLSDGVLLLLEGFRTPTLS